MTPVDRRRSVLCLLAYLALTLIFTWPVGPGLTRDVPGDLGDSLLNMWILAWGVDHLPGLLAGPAGWHAFWNGNIFHPEPSTLALSEHLFGQALQIAPVYALTGNIILGYNLLFLSTFVLSAFGAYLLVRDLTGDWRAAFVAGLVYGFLPYRIAQIAHIQILSSQWMPFVLWGLHRYIARGSVRGLAGGTAALVMQNWSCGYYLLYFAPFVPLFAVHQLAAANRLRDTRAWIALTTAGLVTAALTVPFLLPYLDAQRLFGFERPLGEVVHYSANIRSYATASDFVHLWGERLRLHPRAEGETFLGVTAVLLAAVAIAASVAAARPRVPSSGARRWDWRRLAAVLLAAAALLQVTVFLVLLIAGGFVLDIAGFSIRATTPVRQLAQSAAALAALMAVSPFARAWAARWLRSPVPFFLACAIGAVWLSLGPQPATGPHLISGMGLYGVLYDYVPGFTGLRVPARFAMVAGLFLSVLAGFGAAVITRRSRWGTAIVWSAAVLVMADAAAMPLAVNRTWGEEEATPPGRVYPAASAPPVYHRIRALPPGTAVVEFPFGDPAWEIRYVYYAAMHGKPILNGYSGAYPPAYRRRVAALRLRAVAPDLAWRTLVDTGITHAIVHAPAFADPTEPPAVAAWLDARGARPVERFPDGDVLYELPNRGVQP